MIEIIKILNKDEMIVSGKTICFELGITTRTLRNELANEKESLKKIGIEIISIHRRGYQLNVVDEVKYYNYMSESIRDNTLGNQRIPKDADERVNYLIQRLLVSNDYVKSDDLADELFVSRSTLNNDLISVRTKLSYFELEIVSKPSYGIKISGSEMKLRSAMSLYFYGANSYSDIAVKFDKDSIYNDISDLLLNVMHENNYRLTDLGFKNLVTHIIITLIRMKDNVYVPSTYINDDLYKSEAYELSNIICNQLELIYNLKLPKSERIYIAIHLSGKESSQHIDQNTISFEENATMFNEMYNYINEHYNMDLSHDLDLYTSLSLHFQPMKHRIQYGLRIDNPLLETVRIEQALAFEISIGIAQILEKYWKYPIAEEEIGYVALHLALSIENYEERINKKNIIIVCASGAGSSQILYHKVKQQFGKSLEKITVSELYSLELLDISDYDLILTTVPLNKAVEIPVIHVNYFLDSQDVKNVSTLLKGVNDNADYIDKIFNKSLFFSDISANNYVSVIEEMCNRISKVISLPEGFEASILERESIATTEFGNQVAMPHPMKPMTGDTFVAIGILDKPIRWKNNVVKFVILMSIGKNSKESLSLLHEVIAALVMDNKAMLKFSENPTLDSLKVILYAIADQEANNDIDILFK